MNLSHDASWDEMESILAAQLDVTEAWQKLIAFHEKNFPKPYWKALRALDVQSEKTAFAEWINRLLSPPALPPGIAAFWLGIVRMETPDGIILNTIYLAGSDHYDEKDIDWACDPVYLPEHRYACPKALTDIEEIISGNEEDYDFLDWLLPLAWCAFHFDDIIRTKLETSFLLSGEAKRPFVTGHDSGDIIQLTSL